FCFGRRADLHQLRVQSISTRWMMAGWLDCARLSRPIIQPRKSRPSSPAEYEMIAASDPSKSFHSPRYRWLPYAIIIMTVLTLAAGFFLVQYVQRRLVDATGQHLTLPASAASYTPHHLPFIPFS